MLFDEIYGSYYRAVGEILRRALHEPVTRSDMEELCRRYSFGDAWMNIPAALRSGEWPLVNGGGRSVLEGEPVMPLTLLERRWLKAISMDPRMQLFDADFAFLGDVEPLFRPEDIVCFDRYSDGDDYADPVYRATFRKLMQAVAEKRIVRLTYASRRRRTTHETGVPLRMEYSEKDDRFRVLLGTERGVKVLNLAGISGCETGDVHQGTLPDPDDRESRRVVLEVRNYRNALERVSMHFTHLRKEVERVDGHIFRMTLWYDAQDEPEMIIRVLQYGPVVKVVSPASFRAEVQKRVMDQQRLMQHQPESGK